MHYLMTHPGAAWALTVVHLRLSLLPVLIGLMSAVPLACWCSARRCFAG